MVGRGGMANPIDSVSVHWKGVITLAYTLHERFVQHIAMTDL